MRLKSLTISALVIAALSVTACAKPIDSIQADYDNQLYRITGSGFSADAKLLLEIVDKKGCTIDDGGEISAVPESAVDYIRFIEPDGDGKIDLNFSLLPTATEGEKKVFIIENGEISGDGEVYYYPAEKVSKVISDFKTAVEQDDKELLKTVLQDSTAMNILLSDRTLVGYYDNLKDAFINESNINTILAFNVPDSISDIKEPLSKLIVPFVAKVTSSNDAMKYLADWYPSYFGIDGDIYKEVYSSMSDSAKALAMQSFVNNLKSIAEPDNDKFKACFDESVLISAVKNIDSYTDINAFLKKYNDGYFKLDFAPYEALNNRYPVDSKLTGSDVTYETYAEFRSLFNSLVSVQSSSESGSSSSGGGGGGSKSSGSSKVSFGSGTGTSASDYFKVDEVYFTDIDGYDWAKDSILKLYYRKVISGVGDNRFAPGNNVSRAEFVKLVVSALGMTDDAAMCDFADVDADSWCYKYIASAKSNGIVSGVTETEFRPGDSITREQAACILYNALKAYRSSVIDNLKMPKLTYNDINNISQYALHAITAMNELGLMTGNENNLVLPTSNATRAEAAVIIERLLSYLGV